MATISDQLTTTPLIASDDSAVSIDSASTDRTLITSNIRQADGARPSYAERQDGCMRKPVEITQFINQHISTMSYCPLLMTVIGAAMFGFIAGKNGLAFGACYGAVFGSIVTALEIRNARALEAELCATSETSPSGHIHHDQEPPIEIYCPVEGIELSEV